MSACAMILGEIAGEIQDAAEAQKDCSDNVEKLIVEYARVGDEIQSLQA